MRRCIPARHGVCRGRRGRYLTVAYDTRVHLVITAIGACIFLALYGEKVQGSVGADVVDGAKARLLQVRRRISGTPASKAKRGSALGFKMFFPGEH